MLKASIAYIDFYKSQIAGAFGDLYLATHKQDNKKYAIKHINKEKVIENNCPLSIIYQEISIQLMLSHPNIVRLYSYHENKTDFYLIEEYISKGIYFSKFKKLKTTI